MRPTAAATTAETAATAAARFSIDIFLFTAQRGFEHNTRGFPHPHPHTDTIKTQDRVGWSLSCCVCAPTAARERKGHAAAHIIMEHRQGFTEQERTLWRDVASIDPCCLHAHVQVASIDALAALRGMDASNADGQMAVRQPGLPARWEAFSQAIGSLHAALAWCELLHLPSHLNGVDSARL